MTRAIETNGKEKDWPGSYPYRAPFVSGMSTEQCLTTLRLVAGEAGDYGSLLSGPWLGWL